MTDLTEDLIGALVEHMKGAPEGWESLAMVVAVGDGRVRGTHGYAYGPGGVVSAVASRPSGVAPAVEAYVADRVAAGDGRPVALLVHFDRLASRYDVIFEYEDASRWKVTPANLDAMREELRPAFD